MTGSREIVKVKKEPRIVSVSVQDYWTDKTSFTDLEGGPSLRGKTMNAVLDMLSLKCIKVIQGKSDRIQKEGLGWRQFWESSVHGQVIEAIWKAMGWIVSPQIYMLKS